MKQLFQNWTAHNLISHPLSELTFWLVRPFIGLTRAENIAGAIHDCTIPDHEPGTGRG